MKRALAERAKQSETSTPNGLGPTAVSSAQPPRKIPRIDGESSQHAAQQQPQVKVEPIAIPSQAPSSTTPRPSLSGTPREKCTSMMKRQRSNAALAEEEEGDSSGFYLKHQNRALASELKGLQYQLKLLEEERNLRRQQCQQACQALQALENSWTQMEVALQLGTPPPGSAPPETEQPIVSSDTMQSDSKEGTRNTGSGDSVELVGSLLDSLAALGTPAVPAPDGESLVEVSVQNELHDMKRAASTISQRSIVLQKWLWTLLQRVNSSERNQAVLETAALKGQVALLQSQCRDLEARIAELVTTRDEAAKSDRRVRRGLYRLAAGRMKLDEVLKAVEDDDKDGVAAMMAMEVAEEVASSEKAVASVAAVGEPEEGEVVDGAQVASLKKQLQDLEEIASSRETQIEQLLKEREEFSKRINSLSLPKSLDRTHITEEDVKRSSLYTETATKLVTCERQLAELRARMDRVMEKYATAKGDAELATKTLEDHMANFKKKWAELTGGEKEGGDYDDLYGDAEHSKGNANGASLLDSTAQAKRIVELEHKLRQALENVRQADLARVSLSEAQSMNNTLLQQLEEFKAKYATVIAGRAASRSASETALSSQDKTPSSGGTPVSAEKAEKLHRENRRMKKDLAAAIQSKELAKAKQDKAEKERDELLETNSRLLQQNMEKDDMNAKSLSTILHLKSLTEQAEKEKEAREEEAKSAEQVALAARLAENAKERVAEEALKEKKILEERIVELEKECERVKREKEITDGALAQTKAEMSSLETNVGAIKERSKELTAESARLQEEKRKLMESLAVAQREVAEAAKKLVHSRASGGGGGGVSEFTADQLQTHVSILKSRLACPVCNHRDKECILLRCRHMFCKSCVDENIKNRSRKCPACGQRFDTKDVHDVWL